MNASKLIGTISRNRRLACSGLIGAATALLTGTAGAQVIGDCHDDFSGVQGQQNWFYGFYNGDSDTPWSIGDFELLPNFNGNLWTRAEGPGGYWTNVSRDGGHPNGTITSGGRVSEENWSVRRWVSPGDYVVEVSGRTWDATPIAGQGNGIICHIQVDGSEVWNGTVVNGNEHGLEYNFLLCVTKGTTIDFAIDPNEGNDFGDDTGCHTLIRTIIEHHPESTYTCNGGTVFLSVVTVPGDFDYQWRFNGEPIQHDANFGTYRIVNLTPDRVGLYDCVVTNGCGSMVSDPASVSICRADFDCDGTIDSRDFFFFLEALFRLDAAADFFDDGVINSQDFFDFLAAFFNRC